MQQKLLEPFELDAHLGYPTGRSLRLARKGKIPCVVLPDGSVRFAPEAISRWIGECSIGGKAPEPTEAQTDAN